MDRVEENARVIAEYLENLEPISYNRILHILESKKSKTNIAFCDRYDALNDKRYNCVVVDDRSHGEHEEFLAPDQDVFKTYQNLVNIITQNVEYPDFQIVPLLGITSKRILVCFIGDNLLTFPRSIVKDLMASASNPDLVSDDTIACTINNKIVFLPKSVTTEESKGEKVKA